MTRLELGLGRAAEAISRCLEAVAIKTSGPQLVALLLPLARIGAARHTPSRHAAPRPSAADVHPPHRFHRIRDLWGRFWARFYQSLPWRTLQTSRRWNTRN